MNTHLCPRPIDLVTLLSSVFASTVFTEAAIADAAESGPVPETMLVTAHRVPISEAEAGSSVSTIERGLIDHRQSILATDLLQDIAGISVSRLSGYGSQTQVRLRGAEANHVLVLIDGVKANDPAGSDEFDFSALTAYDIERIEVVRGPQSALWGSEATSGVINISTRQGDGPPSASGFVEGGSRNTLYTGARAAAGSDRGGVALNGSYFNTRGENASLTGGEEDGYETATVGLNANWRPMDNTRLSFSSRYHDAEVEFDGLDFATGLPADADLVSRNDLLLLKGEAGISVLDERWDHMLRLTYLDSDRQQFRDGDWENGTKAEKTGAYYQSTLRVDAAQQNVIFAVDYEKERFEQRGFVVFGDPNQDQERDNLGWVVEYLATPLEGLNLSGSLRHDDNSDFEDVTTYRLTGSYRIARTSTRLRASYGSGQKAPTFTELYGFFPDSFIGNPDLQPEYSAGFDIGVSQQLLDGRWQMNVGYFEERLRDEIVTTFVPGTFLSTAVNLDERSHRQGVEVEAQGRLSEHLAITMSYTYTDSTQPDGVREVRRPRHMAAANVQYEWFDGRAGANLNLSYTGSQNDQIFPPPSFAPDTVVLADYLLVNLAARYRLTERFDVYVRAENLFDEEYLNVVGYRTPGRSIYLGLRLATGR